MALEYPLIDIKDIQPTSQLADTAGAELRQAIGRSEESPSAAWHLSIKPGSSGIRQVNNAHDEIIFHLAGTGIAGHGDTKIATAPGTCRLVPKGTPHYYVPDPGDTDSVLIGFVPGTPDVAVNGLEDVDILGTIDRDGLTPDAKIEPGIAVNLDDVLPENMNAGEGWSITDFRLPLAGHNGCSSTLFRARFFPGAIHKKHRHEDCDEIYYVISGHGLAGAGPDRPEVTGGQFHYIPSGVEHWLHNLSDDETIEVVGIYIDADSVAATGYVYMGEVEASDLTATQ
jgi:mannose-6-phosphate isomerase-like protein (cupin superfamily)